MANEHITKYLQWYLSPSCNSPKFAVLINGGWGSGKTYFIKRFMDSFGDDRNDSNSVVRSDFLYISLYGLNSTSDIDDQIFQQLHPILSSKGVAIAGKIAKGLLKFGLKVDLDSTGSAEASASPSMPDISIRSFLDKFKNKLLVFDDLERCLIPIELLLGYVNAFVEHQESKVIVIANDQEIELGLEETEKKETSKYHRIKEKVIGKTFLVESENRVVIESLLQECTIEARECLVLNKEILFSVFNSVESGTGQRNFRACSHALRDIEYLWPSIDIKFRNHTELMEDFLRHYFCFDYELQLSNITIDDILEIDSWRMNNLFDKINSSNSQIKDSRIGYFIGRHNLNSYNILLTDALWSKLFRLSRDGLTELNEVFGNTRYFLDQNTPNWKKLWHHLDIDDDQMSPLINSVSDSFEKHEYVDPGTVLHVVGLFMWLTELGYFLPNTVGKSVKEILQTGKSYVDWLEANSKLPEEKVFSSIDMRSGCFGLGFSAAGKPEFNEFRDYYKSKTKAFTRKSILDSVPEILVLMKEDPNGFYKDVGSPGFQESKYWNVPIFEKIKPQEFLDNFGHVNNADKSLILESVTDRYKWLNNSDPTSKSQMKDLALELPFWKKFQTIIAKKIKTEPMKPSMEWTKRFHKIINPKIISELNTFIIGFSNSSNSISGNKTRVRNKPKTSSRQ
jgi:hypothetical protein